LPALVSAASSAGPSSAPAADVCTGGSLVCGGAGDGEIVGGGGGGPRSDTDVRVGAGFVAVAPWSTA
jgi:hypothetical protein